MIIGMLGAPSSGKSTLAAQIFSALKELGYPVEFSPEAARFYIAQKKMTLDSVDKGDQFTLTDEDQEEIIYNQQYNEMVLQHSSRIVLTDSCSINGLLYINNLDPFYKNEILESWYDVLFYCKPVPLPVMEDSNRVHDQEQINSINAKIPVLFKDRLTDSYTVPLDGPMPLRFHKAMQVIMRKLDV